MQHEGYSRQWCGAPQESCAHGTRHTTTNSLDTPPIPTSASLYYPSSHCLYTPRRCSKSALHHLPTMRAHATSANTVTTVAADATATSISGPSIQRQVRVAKLRMAKRFFSLDFPFSTLSYYRNRHFSALRGAVPLSLAAIGANWRTR